MERRLIHVLLPITCGLIVIAGCAGTELPLVPVRGEIKFDGGPPPASGTISFMPVPETGVSGLPARDGSAVFGTDGKFEVSSYHKGDGLLPGKYIAKIVCWVGTPSERDPQSYINLDRVPQHFRPKLIVEKGSEPMVINYDVPPKNKATVASRGEG